MNTNLYLIRHGEAVVNVKPIVGGMRGDTGLTELGILQAERLRDRLSATREIHADLLIASTLPRARQTAEIIAPALDRPIVLDEEFQEMRVGEADGMPNREAWQKFGLPIVDRDAFHRIAPGGENWAEFTLRVATALTRVTREHQGKTIVIVCHGGVVDASFIYFFGLNSMAPPDTGFYTYNTSITHWEEYLHDGYPRWRLLSYNDWFHLRDIGVKKSIDWKDTTPVQPEHGHRASVPLPTEEQDDYDD